MNLDNLQLSFLPDLSSQTVEELSVDSNYLRVIPEEFLPRGLKVLRVCFNRIQSDGLPIIFPDSIEKLSLAKNYITDFREVQQMPSNLKFLNLNYNPLSSLQNISSSDSIEVLCTIKTDLEIIYLLPRRLQELHSEKCYISMIPNRLPSTLRILNLNYNRLNYAGLPGYWGDSLVELHLANNKIGKFPRNLPPTIKMINLDNNKLTEVPSNLNAMFPKIQILSLRRNKLRSLPVEYRNHPIVFVDVSDNELIESLNETNRQINERWAIGILEEKNWNQSHHQKNAFLIQKNWRVSRIQARIRNWKRTRVIKEELFCVSMMPERVWQTDVISPEWKRS